MSSRLTNLVLLIVLFFSAQLCQAQEPAKLQLLSHDKYLSLRPAQQEEYIRTLQALTTDLAEDGVEVSSFWNQFVPEHWTTFFKLIQHAQAQSSGDGSEALNYINSNATSTTTQQDALDTSKTYNTEEDCKRHWWFGCGKNADGTWSPPKPVHDGSAPTLDDIKPFGSSISSVISSASNKTPPTIEVTGSREMFIGNEKAEDVLKKNNPNGTTSDSASTTTQSNNGTAQPTATTNNTPQTVQTANNPTIQTQAKSSGDAKDPNKKFRCIYAGFTIYGQSCSPVSEFFYEITRPVSGNWVNFSCTGNTLAQNKGRTSSGHQGKIVTADPVDPKKKVLCNPILFGTIDDKPICVSGKNATKECRAASQQDPKALKKAVFMAKQNPTYYEEFKRTIENLCDGNTAKTYQKSLNPKSSKDLTATCAVYMAQMKDFMEAYDKSPAPSGGGSAVK